MTKKDFESSDDFKEMKLIGESYQTMQFKFINNGSDLACNQNGKDYHVNYWFQIMIMYYGYTSQAIKGDENKLSFLGEARSNFVQLSENAKRMLAEVDWCKRYEFAGFVNQVDALIQMGKLELEAKLLVSQIATNENTLTTNSVLKNIFRWTAIIAGIGVLIAGFNTFLEIQKNKLSQQLHTTDSLLQVKSFENARLKKILDSVIHKP